MRSIASSTRTTAIASPRSARRAGSRRSCCAARARSKAAASSPRTACSRSMLRVERGGPDRVETAVFDWEAGIVTMHDDKTAPLDLPTFDPLALMWQYYFTPPTADTVTVTVATPRRVVALHDHARGNRNDRVAARHASTPSAGIAAATTARPTPTSGSRRRCVTSPSRCACPTPSAARSKSCSTPFASTRTRRRSGATISMHAACAPSRARPNARLPPDRSAAARARRFPTMTGQ